MALSRLYQGQAQVLDYIDYAGLPADHSYGSLPDGQSFNRQEFFVATPGSPNVGGSAGSFIPYANAGWIYTQDFDSLPNPGPTSVNTANPVTLNGITYSLGNPFDFAGPVAASGNNGGLGISALAGWYGLADPGASVGTRFGATDGDQTTGGQLDFGLPGSANRALGLLATSTTGFTAFGAKFINETTNTFTYVNLQFTGEVWRQSNLPKTLEFSYFIDPTAAAPFSTNRTASVPGLNVNFPTIPSAVGGLAVDGTGAIDQANLIVTNQMIVDWPPGAALWLVWEMADPTGKSQGLAIDNLLFSASTQTTTAAVPALSIQTSGTNLVLAWPSLMLQQYQLEFTPNLNSTNWIPLGAPFAGNGGTVAFTNSPGTAPQGYYRLRFLP